MSGPPAVAGNSLIYKKLFKKLYKNNIFSSVLICELFVKFFYGLLKNSNWGSIKIRILSSRSVYVRDLQLTKTDKSRQLILSFVVPERLSRGTIPLFCHCEASN